MGRKNNHIIIKLSLFLAVCLFFCSARADSLDCNKEQIASVKKVRIWKLENKSILVFRSGMNIDADGSPHAYHPEDSGLDAIENAGHPGKWVGILLKDGDPVLQGPNDPAPGYYISPTSLEDKKYPSESPNRYVNAELIPYIALPPVVHEKGEMQLGDYAAVLNTETGELGFAIFADTGPKHKIGEGSIALANSLGVNSDPREGGTKEGIIYILFPGSGDGKPHTAEEIRSAGKRLLEEAGGLKAVLKCTE